MLKSDELIQIEYISRRDLKTIAQFPSISGRGYNFPVALEGALKLKEISYIHAEGYPGSRDEARPDRLN